MRGLLHIIHVFKQMKRSNVFPSYFPQVIVKISEVFLFLQQTRILTCLKIGVSSRLSNCLPRASGSYSLLYLPHELSWSSASFENKHQLPPFFPAWFYFILCLRIIFQKCENSLRESKVGLLVHSYDFLILSSSLN